MTFEQIVKIYIHVNYILFTNIILAILTLQMLYLEITVSVVRLLHVKLKKLCTAVVNLTGTRNIGV